VRAKLPTYYYDHERLHRHIKILQKESCWGVAMTEYHRIRLRPANVYLIKGRKGFILVDAGSKGKEQVFFDYLQKLGISPESLRLIVITHVHYDHVGGLAGIKEKCRCPVAVHASEAGLLEEATVVTPRLQLSLVGYFHMQGISLSQ